MNRGPVVGVVAHEYVVPRPFGTLPVTGSPTWYLDGLVAAGTRPVLLPGHESVDLLDMVDAVVLTGGGDLDPLLSGADPCGASEVDRARDDSEIALVRAAAATGVPLLGVCRGLQVLAVAFGATLAAGAEHIRPHDGHDVTTAPGSVLHDLLGVRVRTSALHHQAIADPGPRWRPTACADDGTIEAIEWIDGGWPVLGIQWHPELTWCEEVTDPTGPALFGWLRNVAKTSAEHRARALVSLRRMAQREPTSSPARQGLS